MGSRASCWWGWLLRYFLFFWRWGWPRRRWRRSCGGCGGRGGGWGAVSAGGGWGGGGVRLCLLWVGGVVRQAARRMVRRRWVVVARGRGRVRGRRVRVRRVAWAR